MTDYQSLDDLKQNESEHTDWRQSCQVRDSWLVVVAPHGKSIEPLTELIAKEVAGDAFSWFVFEGLRKKIEGRNWLHVPSERFRDPDLTKLQAKAAVTLSVHGAADRDTHPAKVTHVGGKNIELRDLVWSELEASGFEVVLGTGHLAGIHKDNFVNQTSAHGVQLEISKSERVELADNPTRRARYVTAIHSALATYREKSTQESSSKSSE